MQPFNRNSSPLDSVALRNALTLAPDSAFLATVTLEGFRWVNAEHGVEIGDRVLQAIEDTCTSFAQRGDGDVYRFGPDWFALLANDSFPVQELAQAATQALSTFKLSRPPRVQVFSSLVGALPADKLTFLRELRAKEIPLK